MQQLTVARLAAAAGVGIETIRYYEKRGLLEAAARTASGYRLYSNHAVTRLRFIKNAQKLGFTLKEIAELVELEQDTRAQCGDLQVRADEKLALIEGKITELERIRAELVRLSSSCESDRPLADCLLMNCLAGAAGMS